MEAVVKISKCILRAVELEVGVCHGEIGLFKDIPLLAAKGQRADRRGPRGGEGLSVIQRPVAPMRGGGLQWR